jgi:hypothetical protein
MSDDDGTTARDWLSRLIGVFKENIVLRRVHRIHCFYAESEGGGDEQGNRNRRGVPLLAAYTHQAIALPSPISISTSTSTSTSTSSASTHHAVASTAQTSENDDDNDLLVAVGQGTVIVALRVQPQPWSTASPPIESSALLRALRTFGRTLAMHIYAREPQFIRAQIQPPSLSSQPATTSSFNETPSSSSSSSPPLNKQQEYTNSTELPPDEQEQEVVPILMQQRWIADETLSVQQVIDTFEQEWRVRLHIEDWVRYKVGEGLVRPKQPDFAEEVRRVLEDTRSRH